MSGYQASCPSCGASLAFELGSTLLRICEHCGSAVARKGANLEAYGRVAELIPTPSVLALGVEGHYEGAPPFRLVGRLQLDHGAGTWDEWLLAFREGSWAWLSESQGKFHYMGVAVLPPVPDFESLRVGQTVDLGPPGTFVVTEVREARFASAQGELPFDVPPGSRLRYADLSGPGRQFATLDYGTATKAEALYVGREVTLAELGMKGLPSAADRRKKARAEKLSCPQCSGPLEIRAPDQTQRVACPYCGSLLDATQDLAVLEALHRVPVAPLIPLGSRGRIDGTEWAIIGFLERSVTVEGVRYPWHEYLLYEPRRGFRWLVEAKGHWSFVEPVHAGDVKDSMWGAKEYSEVRFKHFQGGTARIDHVLGEFYWEVARGDAAQTNDFISPPHMLSSEGDASEIVWSFGTYKEPDEIWAAFRVPGEPPAREGVGPHQPSPWPDAGRVYVRAVLFLGLVLFFFLGFAVLGGRSVYRQAVTIPFGAVPGAPESAVFTEPFEVPRDGNVEVRVHAPVSNSWLYVDGALINEETGGVDEFDVEVSYYSGHDSDGAWSEGGHEARRYLASVPAGRYVMRLAPQWEAGRAPPSYDVLVRSRVPRFYQAVLAALALASWPVIVAWRRFRFEMARWSESDHPWVQASSNGDDE